jgi:Tfp pilus assembly protein PilO
MATPFREWPWPIQALFAVALGVMLVLVGLYMPGSPVASARQKLDAANQQLGPLQAEVNTLSTYDQRRVELQGRIEALNKQLATLQSIVPEDKQVDQFILMLQEAALASGVSIRRLTSKPIVSHEYHFEMPFEIEADGPYYGVLDFFTRLSRLSRIINVGDLKLAGIGDARGKHFQMTPGTSITGIFTLSTFFTAGSAQTPEPASKTKGKR